MAMQCVCSVDIIKSGCVGERIFAVVRVPWVQKRRRREAARRGVPAAASPFPALPAALPVPVPSPLREKRAGGITDVEQSAAEVGKVPFSCTGAAVAVGACPEAVKLSHLPWPESFLCLSPPPRSVSALNPFLFITGRGERKSQGSWFPF